MLRKMMMVAAAVAALSIGVVPTDGFARGGGGGGGGHGGGGGGFGGGFGGGGGHAGGFGGGFGGGHAGSFGGGFGAAHPGGGHLGGLGRGPIAPGFAGPHSMTGVHSARDHGDRGFHHAHHFRHDGGWGYGYDCDYDYSLGYYPRYSPYGCVLPDYDYGS